MNKSHGQQKSATNKTKNTKKCENVTNKTKKFRVQYSLQSAVLIGQAFPFRIPAHHLWPFLLYLEG